MSSAQSPPFHSPALTMIAHGLSISMNRARPIWSTHHPPTLVSVWMDVIDGMMAVSVPEPVIADALVNATVRAGVSVPDPLRLANGPFPPVAVRVPDPDRATAPACGGFAAMTSTAQPP